MAEFSIGKNAANDGYLEKMLITGSILYLSLWNQNDLMSNAKLPDTDVFTLIGILF